MTKVSTKITSPPKSFKGWNIMEFIIGRKKMIITVIGAIGGYIITQNPALAGMIAAGSDLLYAVIEYYVKSY